MADDGASFIIRVEAELEKATQGLDSLQRQVQQVVTAGTERFGALEASIGGTGTACAAVTQYTALGRAATALWGSLSQVVDIAGQVAKALGLEQEFEEFKSVFDGIQELAAVALGEISRRTGEAAQAVFGYATGDARFLDNLVQGIISKATEATSVVRALIESIAKPEDRTTAALEGEIIRLRDRIAAIDREMNLSGPLAPLSRWINEGLGRDIETLRRRREELDTEIEGLEALIANRADPPFTPPLLIPRDFEQALEALRRQNQELEISIATFGMAADAAARYRAELDTLRLFGDEDAPRGPLFDTLGPIIRREQERRAELTRQMGELRRSERSGQSVDRIFNAEERRTEQLDAQARTLTMSAEAAARYNAERRVTLQLEQAGITITDDLRDRIEALAAAESRATQHLRDVQRQMRLIEDAGRAVGSALERAFGDWITGTEMDWRRLYQGLIRDLATLALRSAVIQPLFGGGSGNQPGLLGQLFGGLISGARADGGPVDAGRAYLVGERGPELFLPSIGGEIVPSAPRPLRADEGMRAPITVNFQVTTPDADSFRRSETQIAAMVSRALSRGNRNL